MADTEVQQIKDRTNIVEIVGQYVSLRRAGRNFSGKCPFHKERTPSFMVSPERGTYICFGCGEKGDVFSFLQKIDGIDFAVALRQLADKAGIKLAPRSQHTAAPQEKEKEEKLREVCEAAVSFYEAQLQKRDDVQAYLKARGVSQESTRQWRLGYAPAVWESLSKHLVAAGFGHPDIVDAGFGLRSEKRPGEIFDRFRGRIIFPICDAAGQPIAVSGRFYELVPGQKTSPPAGTEPAKYINSPETLLFKKSKVLYGFDRARQHVREYKCFLLVEGQFDVVMSHQSGFPIAVALSGTALTPEHLTLLGRHSKNLILALDADQAGLRSGLKSALMAIAAGFDVKIPAFAAGQDPADMAKENPELLKAAIRTSKPAIEFFLEAIRGNLPAGRRDDARAYQKLVETQVLPLVAAVESAIEREHFVRLIAQKLGVTEVAVRAEVDKKPALPSEPSPEVHQKNAESSLTPLDKKVGMLLYSRPDAAERLASLLGEAYVEEVRIRLGPLAEELRFSFDSEVHEETTPERVEEDLLCAIADQTRRAKMKSL